MTNTTETLTDTNRRKIAERLKGISQTLLHVSELVCATSRRLSHQRLSRPDQLATALSAASIALEQAETLRRRLEALAQ